MNMMLNIAKQIIDFILFIAVMALILSPLAMAPRELCESKYSPVFCIPVDVEKK